MVAQVSVLHHLSDVVGNSGPETLIPWLEGYAFSLVSQVDCLEDLASHGFWYDDPAAF